MAFFMPLSLFITNAATIMIVVNWFVECGFRDKWGRIKANKEALVFCAIYVAHLLWLINTSNFDYALADLRVKVPLLALPIVLGSSAPLPMKRLNVVLLAFVSGVTVASCIGAFAKFLGLGSDFRALSLFVSNIRLSLMICLSVFILLYFMVKKIFFSGKTVWIATVMVLWLLAFMSMIQSITGYVSFFLVLFVLLAAVAHYAKRKLFKVASIVMLVVVPLVVFGFVAFVVHDFYTPTGDNVQKELTANGIAYDVVESDGTIENGNYVWMNVSKRELMEAWPKYSRMPLDSLDKKGQFLYPTLVRYMTSLGLTKDAEGLSKLSRQDIENVENGETNYRFVRNGGLMNRMYVIIWEFDVYRKIGDCNGHSVTQRIEFLKYGCRLVARNFWYGTGVGDVDDEYQAIYEDYSSDLNPENRFRAHNQFLTFFVAFGLFGFLICMFAWFYPAVSGFKERNYYFCIFFLIATVSMFSDDTLETSTGAVFVAYFYSLLKWSTDKKELHDGQ